MNLRHLAKSTEKMVADNAPAIMTAIGVAGTVATAYFAGKASFKAAEVLAAERRRSELNHYGALTRRDKFEMLWKLYIPAVGTGVLTCTAIICAHRVGSRRAMAMATAYSLSQEAFTEYKEKVIEKIGENKERGVRDELAQDKVNANPPTEAFLFAGEDGKVPCRDDFSGRYFRCDMESLRRAENDINKQIHNSDSATLTNFYNNIGLEPTSISDELGWNTDKFLELDFSSVLYKGVPILTFDFATVPIRDPWRFQ